jgi:hypothetical protein
MDKKLKKYLESYDAISDCQSYELRPNGGMIVLINQEHSCELLIDNNAFKVDNYQALLINAYEESVIIKSNDVIKLIAVRFKGAGASFFYEELMPKLMESPKEPIYLETSVSENALDSYFKARLTVSTLPFNIMKVIDLLDEQGSDYVIDDILAIANMPRKVFDKIFNLRTGLTFKTYAAVKERSV